MRSDGIARRLTYRIRMFGLFRAGRRAAALLALVTLYAAPAQATPSDGRVQQSFTIVPQAQPAVLTLPVGIQPQAAPAPAPVQPTLQDMVTTFVDRRDQDQEQLCLAKAVYFEARGESLEGQLAVAEVVLNRAASGRYPATLCGVVTQRAQFSFIRRGRFPSVDATCSAWQTALAIADIARNNLADQIPANVLWYHANYVAPSWGRRLTRIVQIGAHIFYG